MSLKPELSFPAMLLIPSSRSGSENWLSVLGYPVVKDHLIGGGPEHANRVLFALHVLEHLAQDSQILC